jgi:DNA-binding CsgD family transcriptional regulator/PAS domain-containing protein
MAEGPTPDGLGQAVSRSALPALLLEVPSERVLAASPGALDLLGQGGRPVVGRSLEDFTFDETSGALPLLMTGRLSGYETTRELDVAGQPHRVTLWVRRADQQFPPRHVVAILSAPEAVGHQALPHALADTVTMVIGSTGPDLVVDRVSSDVQDLLGIPVDEVLGRSLMAFVSPATAGDLLWALAQAASGGVGVPVRLELLRSEGSPVLVQALIVPLQPPVSCAFSILGIQQQGEDPLTAGQLTELMEDLAAGVDAVVSSTGMPAPSPVDLSRLSAREAEIVARLLAGDRVPTIAKMLFLSQSTVRNHLSSVFGKLNVRSQQELVHLLRRPDEGHAGGTAG